MRLSLATLLVALCLVPSAHAGTDSVDPGGAGGTYWQNTGIRCDGAGRTWWAYTGQPTGFRCAFRWEL